MTPRKIANLICLNVSVTGIMSAKSTPTKRKGKAVMDEEPYKPSELEVTDTCFVTD